MNIPNLLSIFRLLLIPIYIIVLFSSLDYNMAWACLIFLISGLSDILDGYIARKYAMITPIGKILDPLADKLMQITVFITLLIKGIIPMWIVVIFATKEVLMIAGSTYILKKKILIVESKWYGKLLTVVFYAVVAICLLVPGISANIKNIMMVIILILTVGTITMYAIDTLKIMKKKEKF